MLNVGAGIQFDYLRDDDKPSDGVIAVPRFAGDEGHDRGAKSSARTKLSKQVSTASAMSSMSAVPRTARIIFD
jgi:hypothetical protein